MITAATFISKLIFESQTETLHIMYNFLLQCGTLQVQDG